MYFVEQTTKRVNLDGDYWVDVKSNLTYGDMRQVVSDDVAQTLAGSTESATHLLQTLIVGWNLDDDKGDVLPVTPENIDKLRWADASKIMAEVTGVLQPEEKKSSSSNSSQPSEPSPEPESTPQSS